MSATYLGGLSVGQAVPGMSVAISAGVAAGNVAMPNLMGQISALASYAPTPINLAASIAAAQAIVSALQAQLAAVPPIPAPSLDVQIAAIQGQLAGLQSLVSGINAQLSILHGLQSPLSAAGLHAYALNGATNTLGAAVSTALSSGVPGGAPTDAAQGILLLTTVPATFAALAQIVRVT